MKRTLFGRYTRYVSFVLSAALFGYAGMSLFAFYAQESKAEQSFAALSRRVAIHAAESETPRLTNAVTPKPHEWGELATDAVQMRDTTVAIATMGIQADADDTEVSLDWHAAATPTPAPKSMPQEQPKSNSILGMLKELYAENADLGGWVTIPNTTIDYPVMYTPRNPEKYIRLSFDGQLSSSGVPFMGQGSSISPRSDNIILYGHNMKKGTMFASLINYKQKAYYLEHPSIQFSTLYETGTYDIISAFQTDIYKADTLRCYKWINARNERDFDDFIKSVKEASMYDTGVTANYGDSLLTLSTCSYHTTDGRFVVIAKKS